MKKLLACLIAVSALSVVTAFAETEYIDAYYGNNNEVRVDAGVKDIGGSKTSIIKNASTGEIVHINQKDSGFSSAAAFLLKEGIADGEYIATFGGSDGEVKSFNFYVGDLNVDGITLDRANKMVVKNVAAQYSVDGLLVIDRETGEPVYKKGFTFDNVDIDTYNTFKSIKLTTEDGSKTVGAIAIDKNDWGGTTATGAGSVNFGIQIFDIPESYKGINVYLSTDAATLYDGGSN